MDRNVKQTHAIKHKMVETKNIQSLIASSVEREWYMKARLDLVKLCMHILMARLLNIIFKIQKVVVSRLSCVIMLLGTISQKIEAYSDDEKWKTLNNFKNKKTG